MATLTERIDSLFVKKQARLELQRDVDKMKQDEDAELLAIMHEMEYAEADGTFARVTTKLVRKPRVKVDGWPALYAFIKEHNDFSLLNKALNVTGVRAYWEQGDEVPGVEAIEEVVPSIGAIK
jgi:hypothetical protein